MKTPTTHDRHRLSSSARWSRKSAIAAGLGGAGLLALGARPGFAADAPAAPGSNATLERALTSGVPPDDGLAHPIPYLPGLGTGKDRALVLGGGAFYLTAWFSGYFTALAANGVDLKLADMMVGTSAGTLGSYCILTDQLARMKAECELLGSYPATLNYPLDGPFSVRRAGYVGNSLPSATVANIQTLGRAAMAAHTNPPALWQGLVNRLTGAGKAWPSPKFHTTAIDCYTAQRLVVAQKDRVAAIDAISASSSWPGLAGPTWLKDRTCMDGGTCETSTHADVAGGAKRVLIVSLASGNDESDNAQGLRLSHFRNTLLQEVKNLESGGSNVMLIVAGVPPGYTKVNLLDPALIPVALKYGSDRGLSDAPKLKDFWG